MRLGLLRHFPVQQPFPNGWRTSDELQRWRVAYEASPVVLGSVDLRGHHWARCLSSDLKRAAATARTVFHGDIELSPLLREADFAPFDTGNLRLPVWLWHWVLRFTWATGHRSQRACRDQFQKRVSEVVELLLSRGEETLVVSHAGMMIYLSAELRRRGFRGPNLRMPKHATLYLYERVE